MRKIIDNIVILIFFTIFFSSTGVLCQPIDIDITIKPANGQNIIDIKNNNVITVEIFGSKYLDIHDIEINTVTLGEPSSDSRAKPLRTQEEDIDEDGNTDLLLSFRVFDLVNRESYVPNERIVLELTGMTVDGNEFIGYDLLDIKPDGLSYLQWSDGVKNYERVSSKWLERNNGSKMSCSQWSYEIQKPDYFPRGWQNNRTETLISACFNSMGQQKAERPPWSPTGISRLAWMLDTAQGPSWLSVDNGSHSIGPKWFQTGETGLLWLDNVNTDPWWAVQIQ